MHLQSLPPTAPQESSAIRPVVEAAFRHRRLWLSIVAVVVILTMSIVVFTPRQYQSSMSILVENARAASPVSPQRATTTIDQNGVTEEQINSEIQALGSRSLADVVVDPQWNENSIHTYSSDRLRAHDRQVNEFKKHLSIEMVRKSNVIAVAYSARDPRVANETLNRLLSAFMIKQKEIGHPQGAAQFFTSEAARYKKDLDNAEQQLATYQQEHHIVSLPDTEQALDRQVTDAQAQLRNTDLQISEVSERIREESKQLSTLPARHLTEERSIPNDYSVERLNTLLADLQNQRTALLTKYTPKERLVQQIDKQIADTQAALKNAQQMRSEERSSDVNPVWQQVNGSLAQNQAERRALTAQRQQLAEQISKLQSNLSGYEGSTVAYTTLRQKVTELETNYQTYAQKRDDAMIADAMDESRLLNVAVLQAPTFSVTPDRPKPALELVLGTFTALFLASFALFFAEMGRTTIATPRELESVARYPLLATVPWTPEEAKSPALWFSEKGFSPTMLNPEASLYDSEGSQELEESERQAQAS